MNKDLPLKVRSIFADLDPLIWEGVWLDTLSSLLEPSSMLKIWEKLLIEINLNKKTIPILVILSLLNGNLRHL